MIYGKKATAKMMSKPSPAKKKPAPAKTTMKMQITRLPDTVVKKQISKAEAAKRVIAKMKKK
jgi:hypothetical protein